VQERVGPHPEELVEVRVQHVEIEGGVVEAGHRGAEGGRALEEDALHLGIRVRGRPFREHGQGDGFQAGLLEQRGRDVAEEHGLDAEDVVGVARAHHHGDAVPELRQGERSDVLPRVGADRARGEQVALPVQRPGLAPAGRGDEPGERRGGDDPLHDCVHGVTHQ
jgi:hypothetical protein